MTTVQVRIVIFMMSKMIEITTRIGCSLNCKFCPQELLCHSYSMHLKDNDKIYASRTKPITVLTFDNFQKCIDKVPPEIDIHFSGMCEPWAAPDCTKMVLYAYNKGHKIHIFSTLVGMKLEDYIAIKSIVIENFVIHIPDNEGNSKFLLDNAYLALLDTVINDIVHGIIKVKCFSCHGTVHRQILPLISRTNIPVNSILFDRAGNIAQSTSIKRSTKKKGSIICKWCGGTSLDKNVLLPDGTVLLCCMDYGMQYVLGNLLYEDYAAIDEGEKKYLFRDLLESEKLGNILCRTCHRSVNK